jgi:hypothetical protein
MNLDEAIVWREGFFLNLKAVWGEGKIADGQGAGIVGRKGAMELEGVAGKLDGGFERKAVGSGDVEAEFSGVALRQERESEEEEKDEMEQGAHRLNEGIFMLPAWWKGI